MRSRITYCITSRYAWIILLIFVLLQGGLASCSSEKQLVVKIRPQVSKRAILLMGTDILFKKNLNTDSIPGFKKMKKEVQDSALYYSSRFVQYLDDSLVLNSYLEGMRDELQTLGFKVFMENEIDSIFRQTCPAYILNLAQAEMEEFIFPVSDKEVYDDTLMYNKRFVLYGVNLNIWFELSAVNAEQELKVLFSSHSARDQLKGGFQRHPLTLEVDYRYTVRNIEQADVFGLAGFSSNKDAGYLFDYFLNQDLAKENIIQKRSSQTYWHYDRIKNRLKPAGEWKFELLEPHNVRDF
jgi:hypothetical protein